MKQARIPIGIAWAWNARIALFGLLAITLLQSSAAQTFSREFEAGKLYLLSIPLNINGGNDVSNVFTATPGSSSPATASMLYFWNAQEVTYSLFLGRRSNGEWRDLYQWALGPVNKALDPGLGFFHQVKSTYTQSFSGVSPTPPVAVPVTTGISLMGYAYPVATAWTSTTLSAALPAGSQFIVWDVTGQYFRTFLKGPPAKGGWGGGATNYIIRVGDGFFVRQPPGSTNFQWTQ